MIRYISNYFKNTEKYSTGRFIFEMYVILFLLKFVFLGLAVEILSVFDIEILGEFDGRILFFEKLHWVTGFFILCIVSPIFETVFSQALPIIIFSLISKRNELLIVASASLFTYLHISYPVIGLVYIFMAGIVYAWSFIVYRDKGCIAAVLITSLIHGLSNFIPFILTYFVKF